MKLKCKEGDLAIVVEANKPENLGLIVRVGTFAGSIHPQLAHTDYWHVTVMNGTFTTRSLRQCSKGYCPDSHLQPIRGGDSPKESEISTHLPQLESVK